MTGFTMHHSLRCLPVVAALALCVGGCGDKAREAKGPELKASPARLRSTPGVAANVITLNGFDPAGEPEIRVMPDGSLYVVFSYMPPNDLEEKERLFLDFFAKQMSAEIGLPVITEERELFHIRNPRPDTVGRLKEFIEGYREDHEKEIENYVPPKPTPPAIKAAIPPAK